MKNNVYMVVVIFCLTSILCGQEHRLPLWPSDIPNLKRTNETEIQDSSDIVRIKNVQNPDIAVYLPSKKNATGQAVVICPGGGYHILAYDFEGKDVAKWLNSVGIAGIVLKYRLPVSDSNILRHQSPLLDVLRALCLTRFHANKWNIDPHKIGIIGFSAGGHLASTAGTHFDYGNKKTADVVEAMSSRPDFMMLIYPVISFTQPFMHKGSKQALLGDNASDSLVISYSNELQVTADTPPTFIVHSGDDKSVPVQNSLVFYQALLDHDIPVEMHIYPFGGHGYSLAVRIDHLNTWPQRCIEWLQWLDKMK